VLAMLRAHLTPPVVAGPARDVVHRKPQAAAAA
jgi:hypothetical protein